MEHQFRALLRFTLLASTISLCCASLAWCQDGGNEKNAAKKASDNSSAASDEAESKDAAEADRVESASPADAFAAKLDEWRSLLKEMRVLKGKYEASEDSQLVAIQKQWDELFVRGEMLLEELRQAGMKAFAAAPNEDRQLTRFLVKILEDDIGTDSYEAAAELSQVLLGNGCDVTSVYRDGGIAAFCTNDFDKAEQYLQEFKDRGSLIGSGGDAQEELNSRANQYLGLIDKYRKYWEEEQAIREKEAEADDLPRVKITTSQGEIVVELFENEAPETVANYISLVEKGFYDGLTFHRVIKGFMAQGGCPKGDGSGGPGYTIYCECHGDNYRKHFRGTLSMAHAGRDTGGSQFFLTFTPTAHLNGAHTAFGRVIEGMEVLSKLQRTEDKKRQPDQIVKAEVLRKRDHEYVPNKVQ